MRNIVFRLIVLLAFLSVWACAKIDTKLLEQDWFVNDIVSLDTLHQYDPTGLSLSFKEGNFSFSDINGKSSGGTYHIRGDHIELEEGGYKRIIKVINLSSDSLIIENTSPSGSQILRMSRKSN